MKSSVSRNSTTRDSINCVSPKSRKIRKSSSERKEKEKVMVRLRQMVSADDDSNQLQLVLATIAHIRELQAQLNGKENSLPVGFEQYFSDCCSSTFNSPVSSRSQSPSNTSIDGQCEHNKTSDSS